MRVFSVVVRQRRLVVLELCVECAEPGLGLRLRGFGHGQWIPPADVLQMLDSQHC